MKSEEEIVDIQALPDSRRLYINDVGITRMKVPMMLSGVERNAEVIQPVQAEVRLTVDLDAEVKGIHMSRLLESFQTVEEPFHFARLPRLLEDLRHRQGARTATWSMDFTYFLNRQAPVTGKSAPQGYVCRYSGKLGRKWIKLKQRVEVPVTTLCPCSKAISEYGAHNQRGYVTVTNYHRFRQPPSSIDLCIEDLVEAAEKSASAPLYPMLKRPDERYVTMQAYDNPTFVEDVVRNTALRLEEDSRITKYKVKVENHESIHQHNACATIRRG